MTVRSTLFWIHLTVGVVSGIIIAVMSLTGTALAFEKELIAWSERDARRISPPADDAARQPLESLLAKVREKQPGMPTSVTVYADPTVATAVSFGRTNTLYVDPYRGQIREPASRTMRDFMAVM